MIRLYYIQVTLFYRLIILNIYGFSILCGNVYIKIRGYIYQYFFLRFDYAFI